jgi:protein-tyrosine phosphatase/membrane-associated phospholipid phosphatase
MDNSTQGEIAKPTWLAVLLLAGMGALFFSSYGVANWLASQRAGVPSFYFGWERRIPFLPWTVVPYWSIDLLYGLSFFLWSTRPALLAHAKRLLLAQLISVACFIALPLHFAFERPRADGLPGQLFTLLGGFDKPFNQAPSLHISLLVILWSGYAAHVRGGWRWLLHVWFALIGISVLTTYQHHFIDVPTGLLVGSLCVFVAPLRDGTSGTTRRDKQTDRLARRYGIAASALFLLSLIALHESVVLWLLMAWTALALACVALVYRSGLPWSFGKRANGSFPVTSWCLLAPYLCGAFLNSRWWTRPAPGASQIADGVWIGRFPTAAELRRTKADAVLDLTAELPRLAPAMAYHCLPVLDLTVPTQDDLRAAVGAIETWRARGFTVLICCALGYSRSALVAATWLSVRHPELNDPALVLAKLRAARPEVVLGPHSIVALATFMEPKRGPRPLPTDVHLQEVGHAG